jgi:hypothetical protein
MALFDVDWNPDKSGLRKFGLAVLIGFSLIGGLFYWRSESDWPVTPPWLWGDRDCRRWFGIDRHACGSAAVLGLDGDRGSHWERDQPSDAGAGILRGGDTDGLVGLDRGAGSLAAQEGLERRQLLGTD